MWAETVIEGAGAALQAAQILQSRSLHERTLEYEEKLHEAEMKLLREQHAEEMRITKQTYLIDTLTDMEEHCQELNENLINNSRDAERDMVDQRNKQFFTILLAGTIIFMGVIECAVQGVLDESLPRYLVILFSVCNSGALLFIILNMILCLEVTRRIARFSVRKSKDHLEHLKATMNHTQTMVGAFWGGQIADRLEAGTAEGWTPRAVQRDLTAEMNETYEPKDCCEVFMRVFCGRRPTLRRIPSTGSSYSSYSGYSGYSGYSSYCGGDAEFSGGRTPSVGSNMPSRTFSKMTASETDRTFAFHEGTVHKYLEQRGRINDKLEMLSTGVSFQDYWSTDCKMLGDISLLCFYVGTSLMLVATMILMWVQFDRMYNSFAGAVGAVVTVFSALIAVVLIAVYLRFFDKSIYALRSELESNHRKRNKRIAARARATNPYRPRSV